MNKWIEFKEIDFASDFAWINIDTRDFHGIVVNTMENISVEMPPNYRKNKDKYFHTPDEVRRLINRYYEESGGKGGWRMFSLEGSNEVSGWDMKYISIVNHKCGLLVCKRVRNGKSQPIKKSTLKLPVSSKHLNHCDE